MKRLLSSKSLRPTFKGTPIPIARRSFQTAFPILFRSVPHLTNFPRTFSTTPEVREFQAETRKLLDIVTNSIYTDKEVFIRELISNASDSLEKFRYKQVKGEVKESNSTQLEINITADALNKTLSITDNGIGMTRDELISNLGTIARSGSKQFVEQLKGTEGGKTDGIIGQFGVGFYSSFMVSDEVRVSSISAASGQDDDCNKWVSDGSGTFTIQPAEPEANLVTSGRGCTIEMKLKDSCAEFADPERIKSIIKKYSSFVPFPIKVNGEGVNTVTALWAQPKSQVTPEQYEEFYKFISNAFDAPKYTIHFQADAPIELKVLLFIPSFHTEKFGMGRMEAGVSLYSRRVLIEDKPQDLLPDWMRFVRGVVDSEDLPLSLSREKPQDSSLLKRIREVLIRRVLKHLEEQKRDHPEAYREFYLEFNIFLKEGICREYKFMENIAKLLLFQSSKEENEKLVSLDDYISRCPPEQTNIYYIVAPTREAALASPYMETFTKGKDQREVLILLQSVDDFVMANLKTYGGKTLVSAESSGASEPAKTEESETPSETQTPLSLSPEQSTQFCAWMRATLGSKVREVKTTSRLSSSPALVTDHESGTLRRMLRMMESSGAAPRSADLPPQVLELNPSHPLVLALHDMSQKEGEEKQAAEKVAEQLFDNCLIAAGLVDDPRSMLPRLNDILLLSLQSKK